ncbi:MAG: sugar phosphate isomerase/epimerase [Candidatus Aminicenantes bacterium]|nr:sugar phosphate isomerase/epimerase [Candidatus Aminicenantes bacterium]
MERSEPSSLLARARSRTRGLTVAGTMPVSGSTWSFVGATLPEAVRIYRALGIGAADLIAVPGNPDSPMLASEQILRRPRKLAREILDLGAPVSNLNYNFAPNFHERAINHKDAGVRKRNRKDYRSVIQFCRACRIPSVTVLPGIVQEGWTREKALALTAEELHHMSAMSRKEGITTTFEAHVGSILESPLDTLTFVQSNPELKLTLDYGHFICLGYSQEQVDPLVSYTAHVHLRQAAPQKLQARWDEGTLDFTGIIGKLASATYTGFLSLEYEHMEGWMDLDKADVFTETVKMRNLLRSLA